MGSVTLPGFGSFPEGSILSGERLQQYVPTFLEVYTGESEAPKAAPVKTAPVVKPEPEREEAAPVVKSEPVRDETAPILTEVVPTPAEPSIHEHKPTKKGR
jgi:hypothetical protein